MNRWRWLAVMAALYVAPVGAVDALEGLRAEVDAFRARAHQRIVERERERDRREQERERRERVDALPPAQRAGAELCHQAKAVLGMVVDATRVETLNGQEAYLQKFIAEERRYPPAAEAATALKLSRQARNLQQEAEGYGVPCRMDQGQ